MSRWKTAASAARYKAFQELGVSPNTDLLKAAAYLNAAELFEREVIRSKL